MKRLSICYQYRPFVVMLWLLSMSTDTAQVTRRKEKYMQITLTWINSQILISKMCWLYFSSIFHHSDENGPINQFSNKLF
jgi:hypothetical protein